MADSDDDTALPPRGHGLRGWFGKLDRRRWAGLFVFEFFVVLLGVLAAQALQSWFESRHEARDAAATRSTLERNLRSIALSAEIRSRGLQCYDDRLNRIAAALARGSAPSVPTAAPAEALVIDLGWTGTIPGMIADHYGSDLADRYVNVALWVESLRRAQVREQESWTDLSRLATSLGPVTEADRTAAKGALLRAKRDLLHVSWAARHLGDHARALGIRPDLDELSGARSASDRCVRAVGYTIDQHLRARSAGKLVTGEPIAMLPVTQGSTTPGR